jgi:hypothetical protein
MTMDAEALILSSGGSSAAASSVRGTPLTASVAVPEKFVSLNVTLSGWPTSRT